MFKHFKNLVFMSFACLQEVVILNYVALANRKLFQLSLKLRNTAPWAVIITPSCCEDDIFLQFALCDDNKYILDYKAPFNVLTAFAVGIVTLSQKMLCEQIKD